MTNPYNYCTRCGDELSDELADAYHNHSGIDIPLCKPCWNELLAQITGPLGQLLSEAFQPLIDAAQEMNEVLEEYEQDDE